LKCDGTHAKTRFRLSAKLTSPFKFAGASVQSNTGSCVVRISGSNAGYTMFRGSVKGTGCPLHLPVSPSLPPPMHYRVPSHFNWSPPTTAHYCRFLGSTCSIVMVIIIIIITIITTTTIIIIGIRVEYLHMFCYSHNENCFSM